MANEHRLHSGSDLRADSLLSMAVQSSKNAPFWLLLPYLVKTNWITLKSKREMAFTLGEEMINFYVRVGVVFSLCLSLCLCLCLSLSLCLCPSVCLSLLTFPVVCTAVVVVIIVDVVVVVVAVIVLFVLFFMSAPPSPFQHFKFSFTVK